MTIAICLFLTAPFVLAVAFFLAAAFHAGANADKDAEAAYQALLRRKSGKLRLVEK
jgi:hypothetical protein